MPGLPAKQMWGKEGQLMVLEHVLVTLRAAATASWVSSLCAREKSDGWELAMHPQQGKGSICSQRTTKVDRWGTRKTNGQRANMKLDSG